MLQKQWNGHSNIDHPCPYSVGLIFWPLWLKLFQILLKISCLNYFQGDLYVRDWVFDNSEFTFHIPNGEWRLDIQYFMMLDKKEVPMFKSIIFFDMWNLKQTTSWIKKNIRFEFVFDNTPKYKVFVSNCQKYVCWLYSEMHFLAYLSGQVQT